ncbi:MAG: acetyltransferase [Ginsengibacter sp.]
MGDQFYIYGASGHSKVIIEILERSGNEVYGLFDDDPKKKSLFEYPVSNRISLFQSNEFSWIIGIGNNKIRKEIAEKYIMNYGFAIDKSACVSKRSKISEGTVIMPGVTINSSTIVGKQAIINTNSSVDHDCVIADYVHISPNATLCGGIKVGEGTHIGAGAVVIPGINIGKWVTVGAGSVIIKDVPDYSTIIGNPGKLK